MLSRDLCDAIETLLAGPYSEDQHGYAHYINMSLFENLRTAYQKQLKKAVVNSRTSPRTPQRTKAATAPS